jgi:hypothetical protein
MQHLCRQIGLSGIYQAPSLQIHDQELTSFAKRAIERLALEIVTLD